jgi:ParB-like partition proteins
LFEVPVNAVSPNPKQPRTRFDDDTIEALAASIREVGILQPIVVRKAESGYELIAGERRLRAAKLAGLPTIPVVVRDTDDSDTLREALIENIHRQDLGPIELAEAFRQLLEELGLKQEELADRVGVSRSHIANTIRLLQLPLEVQQQLTDGKIQAGHARTLLSLGDADAQRSLALRIAAEDLSVREVEEAVRAFLEASSPEPSPPRADRAPPPSDSTMAEIEEILSEQLATRVQIQMGKKRGRVVIEFGSADDLERIVSEIIGSGPGLSPA